MENQKYQLFRDKKLVHEFDDELGILAYIHKHHSYSADWAFKHEGYSVKIVDWADTEAFNG